MRVLEKIGFGLFLLAGALVLAGESLSQPALFRVALIAFGLMGCVGGVRSITTREVQSGRYDVTYQERFTGASAWMVGIVLLLGGAVVVALATLDLVTAGGASTLMGEWVAGSPRALGLILGLAGIMFTAFGIARILSGSARASGPFARHVEISFKVGGVYTAVAGLVLVLVALGLIIVPEVLGALFQQAVSSATAAIQNP